MPSRRRIRRLAVATVVCACLAAIRCGGGGAGGGSNPNIPGPNPNGPSQIPSGPEIFVGAGDIAVCGGSAEATARQLDGIGGTVFTLGDNAYPTGTRSDFQNCYEPTWGRHKGRTRSAPGNHDYATPGAVPYYEYFGANAGPFGLGYYSFDLGTWHIISLNTNIPDNGSVQLAWLRADLLQNAGAKCTLAFWHHPVFSSGPNGSNPNEVAIRAYGRELYRMLYDANADVILSGHDHLYERFAPQTADGILDPSRGIREFVVGTGGVPLYEFQPARPNSEVRLRVHGVIKLTLATDRYAWDFLPVSGSGDSGSTACH
jgi:3',5'-cyclic AMP phosphodiesterase CpdA